MLTRSRIITWNMQGGGTPSSVNASLQEKLDFLLGTAANDRFNIICLQEIGTGNTSLFAPKYGLFAPSDPKRANIGIFTYRGRRFYAAFQEDFVASVARCTTAILCDPTGAAALLPKFGLGKISTNSRPFLYAAIGGANVACAHCTAHSAVSSNELRDFAITFFNGAPLSDNVIAGDFNQTPDDAKRDDEAKRLNLYPLDMHTLRSEADAKAYVVASDTFTQGAAGVRNHLLDFYIVAKKIRLREGAALTVKNVSTATPAKNYSDHNLQALELNLDI